MTIRQFVEATRRAVLDAKRYCKDVEDPRERQLREVDRITEDLQLELGPRYDAFKALIEMKVD